MHTLMAGNYMSALQTLVSSMPIILRCLVYERNLGAHSVGAHVRDAACYLLWGLARTYDPAVLSRHHDAIAKALIVVACFDREVHGPHVLLAKGLPVHVALLLDNRTMTPSTLGWMGSFYHPHSPAPNDLLDHP